MTHKRIAFMAGLLLVAQTASARDLAYQTTVTSRSAAGVPAEGSPILNRLPGLGRAFVFEAALDHVLELPAVRAFGGDYNLMQNDTVSLAKSPTWSLEVRGDGDWIRFRHSTYHTSSRNTPRALSAAMSDEEVESVAKRIVPRDLAPLVTLGKGEALQPWSVAHLISVIGDVNTGNFKKAIHVTRITLTRVINGVPVLGAGSKIAVEVANDGTLVGFDIDWSQLTPGTDTTSLLDVATIKQRAQQLVPSSSSSPREVEFKCGYYDTGAGFGRSAQVQPACTIAYESLSKHFQFAVPAGSKVIKDATWTESATFGK